MDSLDKKKKKKNSHWNKEKEGHVKKKYTRFLIIFPDVCSCTNFVNYILKETE